MRNGKDKEKTLEDLLSNNVPKDLDEMEVVVVPDGGE